MLHFLIFGSHPRLSLAEFCAVKPNLQPPQLFGPAAIIDDPDWDGAFLNARLGGTVKLGDVIKTVKLEDFEPKILANVLAEAAKNKAIDFGLTVYASNKQKFAGLGIKVKKELKSLGVPARWVSGKDRGEITPAAVAKLNLTERGSDLCVFADRKNIFIGVTSQVQDADAWSKRDYGRPARDQVSGMLPPKLARLMVNLARIKTGETVIDPFCGCGTILMEAALATEANLILGSDIDAQQVSYSVKNISWLVKANVLKPADLQRILINKADARSLDKSLDKKIDVVVTEGYLGPPLSGDETVETLRGNVQKISHLWQETYQALWPILNPKARLVCVWPCFKSSHGTARVDLSEDQEILKKYKIVNPLQGFDDSGDPLLYLRPGQRVMRRIVVLEKK